MADLQPLRTLRYDSSVAGPLEDLIAPPYDVIDDAMRAELAARSPYNVVHVDLPPTYEQAAATMEEWRARGVLAQEEEPAVWVLRQDYRAPDGADRTRTGFLARVRVDEYGPGRIRPARAHPSRSPRGPAEAHPRHAGQPLPHLHALSRPRGDRRARHGRDQPRRALRADGRRPALALERPGRVAELQMALADAELLIADGHHRYETARVYAEEVGGEGEHRYVLMLLCSLNDPGLLVFPTHRLLTGLAEDSAKQLAIRDVLMRDFEIGAGGASRARAGSRAQRRGLRLHGLLSQEALPRDSQGPGHRRPGARRHAGALPASRHGGARGPGAARGARHERGRHLSSAWARLLQEPRRRDRRRDIGSRRRRLLHARHPGGAGARSGGDGRVDAPQVDLLLPQGPHGARLQSAR